MADETALMNDAALQERAEYEQQIRSASVPGEGRGTVNTAESSANQQGQKGKSLELLRRGGNENPYLGENRLSSVNQAEMEAMERVCKRTPFACSKDSFCGLKVVLLQA